MSNFLQYTVFGIMFGAGYAIAATGLVVTYTTSGVFNFAQGAVGMVAAFCYWQLVTVHHVRIVVALALVCAGSRLVFESVVFPYYLLAASVLIFVLDLVARRSPHRSLAWCAVAAFFVAFRPGNQAVDAVGTLLLAAAAVAAGGWDLVHPPGAVRAIDSATSS